MRVALSKCTSYDPGMLPEAVEKLLSALGGPGMFVRKGQSVLIKPNLLTDRAPEQAVTTHPELARALIRVTRDLGADPVVGDSPARAVKLERVWQRTGFESMCSEEKVPLLSFERQGSVHFNRNGYSFSVAKPVVEADVIINLPKVKTHVLTTFTGATKNMYGVLPGYQKAHFHKEFPDPSEIAGLLLEICRTVPPALSIADGVVGMEGDGPSGGQPVELGFLAAGSDPVALDTVLCRALGISTRAVPYLRNFLETTPEPIEVVGVALEEVTVKRFRKPGTLRARMIPGRLVKLLGPLFWIRPRISPEHCTRCGRCVSSCPVDALLTDDAAREPNLLPQKCMGCCCCHEMCPSEAISMIQSPVLKMISGRDSP